MRIYARNTVITVTRNTVLAGLLLLTLTGCSTTNDNVTTQQKIHIDQLEALNPQGLYGPPDGLRSLSYEFCIPNEQRYIDKVKAIDPTVTMYSSPGRIGCQKGKEFLCIGHTAQPHYRQALNTLASQPYLKRIEETWFE